MSLRYDVVVLDFDGTVSRSGPGITRSAAIALERMGKPVPEQSVLDRFVGPPLLFAFQEYCGLTEDEARAAIRLYREHYGSIGMYDTQVYAGLAPLFRQLKAEGAWVAIASGKPERFLRPLIEFLGLKDHIDAVAGPGMESMTSDKSEQVRAVLPAGADLSRVCMIGDRRFDIEAAKALGVCSIGVTYGYGTREELEQAGADIIADTVSELWDILTGGTSQPQGRFITFEGSDGCGKTTQLRKLDEYLRMQGWETVVTREPGGCAISERLREIILGLESTGMSAECEALLYAASRIEHVKRVILPALEAGKIVLCDRFYDSSFAYQACGRQLGADFIRQINEPALRLVHPDLTLQFDIDRERAKERMSHGAPLDRLELEKEEFFTRVAEGYRQCAEADPGRICRIDSGRGIDEVFEDVLRSVRS